MFLIQLIAALFVIFVIADYLITRHRIQIGRKLAMMARPFSRNKLEARMKILVIGDSTALGTGASQPEHSLAGLLGASFSEASIENHGVNGAKTKDLIKRLERLKGKRYDLMMIHIGGNDVVRFTERKDLMHDIDIVLRSAKQLADKVVLVSTGNVGTAKLLPLGTRWLFTWRTRQVRDVLKTAAAKQGISYVDLFREPKDDPFARDPSKYYAADSFHPSDEGYLDWFQIIRRNL
jgi:lysophospholipase L1-like esterase